MAKEKKLVQSITSRDEDFAQWYTDVVREAKLCDYSGVKGCLNYLPKDMPCGRISRRILIKGSKIQAWKMYISRC